MMNAEARTESRPLNADRLETAVRPAAAMSVWQLNLLRVGYFVVGVGLVVFKWPLLFQDKSRGLAEGTVLCILVAMSVMALLGLRYPQRMLPILLFEVAWKLTWLAVVALPAWMNHTLDDATREQASTVLWVVIVMAVIPWRQVFRQYVLTPGDAWRRSQ